MQRDLSAAEMEALLSAQVFGHLACQEGGKPYIIPLAYYYHDGVLYGQTMEGKKTRILRENPRVCFQVQQLTPNGWQSVLCWGVFEEVALDESLAPGVIAGLEGLATRIGAVQGAVGIHVTFSVSNGVPSQAAAHGTIFYIRVVEKSGRAFFPERQS